eukprot:COSAG02_NODE_5_length_66751_cov_63.939148_35_plen_40_part_00
MIQLLALTWNSIKWDSVDLDFTQSFLGLGAPEHLFLHPH